MYVFFIKQKNRLQFSDCRWQSRNFGIRLQWQTTNYKPLNRNIKSNSGALAWNRIKKHSTVDVLNPFFHKKQSHSRFAISLFFRRGNVKTFSIVIYYYTQQRGTMRKLDNNMRRIGIFQSVVDGFLRQSINVDFD